jgi:cellulose synthase (UDP-forming)
MALNLSQSSPYEQGVKFKEYFFLLILAITLIFLFYGISAYLTMEMQLWAGWVIVGLILLLKKYFRSRGELQRIFIILLCFFLTARYWYFRTSSTLVYTGFFASLGMAALYLAESYGILTYILGMFVNISPLRRTIQPVDLSNPDLPSVDVFIPTYNEPETLVGITAAACSQLDYPKDKLNVYILDDGGTVEKRHDPDPEKARKAKIRHQNLKALAEFLEINYATRDRNIHAKAGNITHALFEDCPEEAKACFLRPSSYHMGLSVSGADLILILDCDHAPTRDFLRNTVRYFMEDEKVFLVQTPHFFINPDPVEKNLATFLEKPSENEMFYGGVQLGLDFWNASFFCGSAAILRRKHLEEIGGIAGDTITEDAETALMLHAKGYKSVYLSRPMICGLSPETFGDFILQRSRWAQGMTQILMLKNPLFIKGLTMAQRICYLNTCIFWFFGFARFMFFLAPLLYLFFGFNIYNATLEQVLAYAAPHILGALILTDYMFGELRHPFFSELYEVVQSVFNVPAVLGTIFRPRSPTFKVTPKTQSLKADALSPLALPFYIMLMVTLAAFPFAILRYLLIPPEHSAVYITTFWALFNLMLIFLCLGVVWEKRQLRKKHRIHTEEEIFVRAPESDREFKAMVFDLSEDGVGFKIPLESGLRKGNEIKIRAIDSYGHEYSLPAQISRTSEGKDNLTCGCEFMGRDSTSWLDIVTYVYGDSKRWDQFWRKRREHRQNAWRGIAYLIVKGAAGSYQNFSGLAHLSLFHLKNYGTAIWNHARFVLAKL